MGLQRTDQNGSQTDWIFLVSRCYDPMGARSRATRHAGYWSASGTIDTLPNKIAFLFNQDKSRTDKLVMAHTGIYDGTGNVIQAGGQYPGVSDKPLNRKKMVALGDLEGR